MVSALKRKIIELFSLLPLPVLYVLSDMLFMAFIIFGYRKDVVRTNLKNSFPEKTKKEINQISKKFYKHLGDLIVETLKLRTISKKEITKRYQFRNTEVFENAFKNNRNIIAFMGHYCNWEWMACAGNVMPHEPWAIYRPLKNKAFNDYTKIARSRLGMHLTTAKDTLRTIMSYKNSEKKFFMIFLGDQSPSNVRTNYWTSFLNQDTLVFMGTEKIAKKIDSVIVFLKMTKIRRGHYLIDVIELFDEPEKTNEYEITNAHLKTLENIIRETPEYWLWSHRRWKRKKPQEANKSHA